MNNRSLDFLSCKAEQEAAWPSVQDVSFGIGKSGFVTIPSFNSSTTSVYSKLPVVSLLPVEGILFVLYFSVSFLIYSVTISFAQQC